MNTTPQKIYKPGDPCPCCGQPIRTNDPQILLLLSLIRDDVRYREAVADAAYCARDMRGTA